MGLERTGSVGMGWEGAVPEEDGVRGCRLSGLCTVLGDA